MTPYTGVMTLLLCPTPNYHLLHLLLYIVAIAICFMYSFTLSPPVPPVAAILDSQKPAVIISEGVSGVLMCTATGVPAPTISWFMNGTLLADDGVTNVIATSTTETMESFSVTSTLNAINVMRESAFAIITCTASNGVGANSSESTQLIVLCKSLREGGMRCGRKGIKCAIYLEFY